jgi:hypothetical protein
MQLIKQEDHLDKLRTVRIASGRNTLIGVVEKMILCDGKKNPNIYTAMIDMDEVMMKPMNKENFENRMLETKEWDVITFNRRHFYDLWALRYSRYDINLLAHGYDVPNSYVNIKSDIVRQLGESRTKYYPVYSAFNGLAVYKYDYTIGCKYNGSSQESGNNQDCEHVAFHRCITARHGGRVMIHVNYIFLRNSIRCVTHYTTITKYGATS